MDSASKPNAALKLYNRINGEKGKKVCTGIDEQACAHVPRNYFIILLSNLITKLGDTLSNPKTVLTWVMTAINAPVYLIGFIVPIRESGSMLPQIFIAHLLRSKPIRKWVWVTGSILQFLAITAIGLVALNFEGTAAGWYIVICLILFSFSRCLCSVSSKDVLGKTIPKTRRGRLKGYTASVSGVLVLIAGVYLVMESKGEAPISFYAGLIMFAGGLWLIAALIYAFMKEFPGETDTEYDSLWQSIGKIRLIRTDKNFRNFIIARSLLLSSALTAPFYVVLAQEKLGNSSWLLGLFIIAGGVANVISSPFWGRFADSSSKNVMSIAALITSALGILFFIITFTMPNIESSFWLYPIAFFILGIAHSGVRLGRKTYVVDMAEGNARTDYVAVSNTIIGLILLVTGGLSALASSFSVEGIILILSVFGLYGAYRAYQLPNVE